MWGVLLLAAIAALLYKYKLNLLEWARANFGHFYPFPDKPTAPAKSTHDKPHRSPVPVDSSTIGASVLAKAEVEGMARSETTILGLLVNLAVSTCSSKDLDALKAMRDRIQRLLDSALPPAISGATPLAGERLEEVQYLRAQLGKIAVHLQTLVDATSSKPSSNSSSPSNSGMKRRPVSSPDVQTVQHLGTLLEKGITDDYFAPANEPVRKAINSIKDIETETDKKLQDFHRQRALSANNNLSTSSSTSSSKPNSRRGSDATAGLSPAFRKLHQLYDRKQRSYNSPKMSLEGFDLSPYIRLDLKSIDLSACELTTDSAMRILNLLAYLPKLRHVSLANNPLIGGDLIEPLVILLQQTFPALRTFDLSNCDKISESQKQLVYGAIREKYLHTARVDIAEEEISVTTTTTTTTTTTSFMESLPIIGSYLCSNTSKTTTSSSTSSSPSHSRRGSQAGLSGSGKMPTRKLSHGHGRAAARSRKRVAVLSLDGGGIRGLISIHVLKCVFIKLSDRAGRTVHIHDVFDHVVGTSTGAMIGTALVVGKTLDEIHDIYRNNVRPIFEKGRTEHGLYDHTIFERQIADKFGEWAGKDFPFDHTHSHKCKPAVVVVETNEVNIFGSIKDWMNSKFTAKVIGHQEGADIPGVAPFTTEVCIRASTAAPTYFSELTVNVAGQDTFYVDGGCLNNNPSEFFLNSCLDAAESVLVFSVGTGLASKSEGLVEFVERKTWGETIDENSEEAHVSMQKQAQLAKAINPEEPYLVYDRINPSRVGRVQLGDVKMDEFNPDRLDTLEHAVQSWLESNVEPVDAAVDRLWAHMQQTRGFKASTSSSSTTSSSDDLHVVSPVA